MMLLLVGWTFGWKEKEGDISFIFMDDFGSGEVITSKVELFGQKQNFPARQNDFSTGHISGTTNNDFCTWQVSGYTENLA